ncbi:nucleotidyltransferase family protein [Thermodesulfobacteriota bacterium]
MDLLQKHIIQSTDSIKDAIKKIDVNNVNMLVVLDPSNRVLGVFTMGDFRKAVLKGLDINHDVSNVTNHEYLSLNRDFTEKEACHLFETVSDLPVIDNGKLVDVIARNEFLPAGEVNCANGKIQNVPVVIMAGGKGTRLDPFTRILPKPLIPIGTDAMIKVVMDEFARYGMNDFFITLNEKARMIKAYFHDHNHGYQIQYIEESKPLGTAGALKLLSGKVEDAFFVCNCDIIIHTDYSSIYEFHQRGSFELTLIASMQQYTIPYGVCEINKDGTLKEICEKPDYDFLVNTGLYILNPSLLELIPDNTYFDMTDLIKKEQENGLKVGVFPISEKSWIDVGQLGEYKRMVNKLSLRQVP